MSQLVLSLNSNILKISVISKIGFKAVSKKVPESICNDTDIIDSQKFADYLKDILTEIEPSFRKKYSLNFLVEPKNAISEFITVRKGIEDTDGYVLGEVQKQLEGVSIEELYYTHQRIAPFIRHFVGVRKADLNKYVEIAQMLGMELRSVVSWVSLLPKYLNISDQSVLVAQDVEETILSFCNLGAVFFSRAVGERVKSEDLAKFIKDLSNYEHTDALKKVFVLGDVTLKLDEPYEVTRVTIPNSNTAETAGYEKHLLFHYMVDFAPDLFTTPMNLLSLLPVPATEKKSSALVYAGSSVAVILLIGGIIFGRSYFLNKKPATVDNNALANGTVLSEQNNAAGETQPGNPQNTQQNATPTGTGTTQPASKPDPKLLKIRVDNGAGISGLAKKTKDILEKQGYTVSKVGDADIVGRQNTLLKFKKDKLVYKDALLEQLKANYLDIVVEEDLDNSLDYDLLMIVGTNVKGL